MSKFNKQALLIEGRSTTGKTSSLRNLVQLGDMGDRVLYLNCESGKDITFPNKFKKIVITDPLQVPAYFDKAKGNDSYDVIVVDSASFLMEMYESQYVLPSDNTMAAWGDYQQFFKNLMQKQVATSDKFVIFTSHVGDTLNESSGELLTQASVKGALAKNGLEAYFTHVICTKCVSLRELEKYSSDLLSITEEEEIDDAKHVFQTRKTRETRGERMRGPMFMWAQNETMIDNDVMHVINRINEFNKLGD